MPRLGKRRWLACVFRADRAIAGETRSHARMETSEGPRATVCQAASLHRRARACPSPCLGRGNGVGRWTIFAQVVRSRGKPARMRVWHPRAPALRYARPPPFHRRGEGLSLAVPRSGKRRWFACVFRAGRTIAGDRPPRYGMPGRLPSTVGRGPVPRHASIEETALVGVRFLRGSGDRGGQAPALRARKGFSSPCAVRDQASPNYGLILLIVILL